jgi:oxaloacetate decarboxylase gamma subunit
MSKNYRGGFMTVAAMFEQSAILTLLGMGIVFGFLVVLIISVELSGKVVHAAGWDKDVQAQPAAAAAPAAPAAASSGGAVTAAISAAVTEFTKKN